MLSVPGFQLIVYFIQLLPAINILIILYIKIGYGRFTVSFCVIAIYMP